MTATSTTGTAGDGAPAKGATWFGHPAGLTVLATTEMWEVFSFIGMKTLLVYYMTKDLGFAQQQASLVYGLYGGCAYFTPILGGIACGRWLTRRQAVTAGGLIMALGHFLLIFPSLFFPALATVALGAGLYLPALPSQVGGLYAKDDPRKDSAYSVYYLGMNLGALLAPLVCGTLGELFGWHWGFGAAGIGMLIGVSIYSFNGRHLPPEPPRAPGPAGVGTQDRATTRSGLLLIVIIAAVVVVFRGAYEQIGNTLAIWLDGGVDRRVGGFVIPMTWFQSINPLLVITLTPLIVARWARLAKAGRETPSIGKMGRGGLMLAAGYLLLSAAAAVSGAGSTHWMWFVAFVAAMTLGELYVMPICLGLFGRLSSPSFATMAAAIWFATAFGGNLLAGLMGSAWSATSPALFFAAMAGVAFGAAILFLVLAGPVAKVQAQVAAAST
ncbi:peptide MFS transporter [Phenylobacterium sp.]|uniref:peptide MFS transporter n=1 Tax=Phenylobacterium sp. TaxID=1871053 RepID=UPI002EDA2E50